MPDLMDFLLYSFYNTNFKAEHLGTKKSTARLCNAGIALLEYFRKTARKELIASRHFTPPSAISNWRTWPRASYPWATRPARDGSSQVR